MLRQLRAILAFAILWAGVWAVVGFGLGLIKWLRFAREFHPVSGPFTVGAVSAILCCVLGALCGGGFAVLMSRAERDRTIGDLSLRRTALWGGLGGALPLLAIGVFWSLVLGHALYAIVYVAYAAIFGAVGATLAGLSLAAARKAQLETPDVAARLPAT
jgi:hypothetical protein